MPAAKKTFSIFDEFFGKGAKTARTKAEKLDTEMSSKLIDRVNKRIQSGNLAPEDFSKELKRLANRVNSNNGVGFVDDFKQGINDAWMRTTREQDSIIGDAMGGGALTGAGIAGIGSLFTDAGFMESAVMGGLTGGLGAGYMQRKNILGAEGLSKRNAIISRNDELLGRRQRTLRQTERFQGKMKKTGTTPGGGADIYEQQLNKRGVRANKKIEAKRKQYKTELESNRARIEASKTASFGAAGTLGGFGSLAYATLDSNRY